MAKYPREEISYKKLYKKLDLNKSLGIDWPEISENNDVFTIDINQPTEIRKQIFTVDEFDEDFCEKNNIKITDFIEIFKKLDKNFIKYVFKKFDQIKLKKTKKPCDICGKYLFKDNEKPVLCQGCNIPVHASCYGIFESSNERWLCKSCIFHYENPCCKYCNKNNGILKKTDSHDWGHMVCALLLPGISFCNTNIKDPIDDTEVERMEGNCSICNNFAEYAIKCSHIYCNKFYHPSCAANLLYCDIGNHITYCDEHNPLNAKKKIQSKRSMLKDLDAYPELTNEILIRKPMKLTKRKKGKYLKIINKGPKIIKKGFKDIFNQESFKIIADYWKTKRTNNGYYFEDLFMFPNYFLKNS